MRAVFQLTSPPRYFDTGPTFTANFVMDKHEIPKVNHYQRLYQNISKKFKRPDSLQILSVHTKLTPVVTIAQTP